MRFIFAFTLISFFHFYVTSAFSCMNKQDSSLRSVTAFKFGCGFKLRSQIEKEFDPLSSKQKINGVTSSSPKLQSPRLNVISQSKAAAFLAVSAGLLIRPKAAVALVPIASVPVSSEPIAAIPITSIPTASASASVPITTEKKGAFEDEQSVINGIISGAATRVSKELLLHPIDTVRARLQVAPDPSGVPLENEGLFNNLYDGLLPALVGGVPAGGLFFGIKDYSKKKFRKMGLGKQESTVLSVMAANIPYWVVRTPSEVLKTRMQIGYDNSSSIGEMIGSMATEEGGILPAVQSTYKSYIPNFVYALPADIVKFVAYEALTSVVLGVKEGEKIQGLQAVATGAAAGLIAQAVTTPLDVVRTRIMTRSSLSELESEGSEGQNEKNRKLNTNNPIEELINIVEAEGTSSLFKGLLPRATRALASGAIQFGTYEFTQNALLKR